MTYTAVKLADVNKAIAAAKTAQTQYDAAVSSVGSSKAEVEKAQKARDEALAKVNSLKQSIEGLVTGDSRYATANSKLQEAKDLLSKNQQYYDSKQYLKDNSAYQNALTAYNNAVNEANKITQYRDSGDYLRDDKTYQGALNLLRTREEELKKANDFRNNSSDRYNNDSDIKYNRQKVEDSKKAIQTAQDDLNRASDRDKWYYENKLNEAKSQLSKWENELQTTIERSNQKADDLVNSAIKNREEADKSMVNSRTSAENSINSKIASAQSTRNAADANVVRAENSATAAAKATYDAAKTAFDTADSTFGKVNDLVRREYDTKYVVPAQDAFNKAEDSLSAANTNYGKLNDSLEGLSRSKNQSIGSVADYVNQIKDSLKDVKSTADANQVKTLLSQIQSSVKNTNANELISTVNPLISSIDPLKMAAIPTVNLRNGNPDVFGNIDTNTGLPILNQGGLDSVLDSYKSNQIDTQQYRDNWNKFGWNAKSDASMAMRGAAILGLDKGRIQEGMQSSTGFVKAGTSTAATDADFKKAADALHLDINNYYTAQGNKLDKESLYNDIADKTKDFYLVANTVDGGNNHASILFKADGNGNLVPVVDANGNPTATYYSATRNVTGQNWYDDLIPIAAIAAAVFAPEAISAISAAMGGTTAATIAASSIYNASVAAVLGGDPTKAAALAAAGAVVAVNSSTIANTVAGSAENVEKLAEILNVSVPTAEKIIASGFGTGIVSAAIDPSNALSNAAAASGGQLASAEAKNVIQGVMEGSPSMNAAVDIGSNLAQVGAQAVIKSATGQNIDVAGVITNAIPNILISGVQTGIKTAQVPVEERGITAGEPTVASAEMRPYYPQIGEMTAALDGSTFGGKTVTDVGFGGEGTKEPLFPGAGAVIGVGQQVGPIRTVTTDQGEQYQARDITYQNGTKATILYDPVNDKYKQIVTFSPEETSQANISPTVGSKISTPSELSESTEQLKKEVISDKPYGAEPTLATPSVSPASSAVTADKAIKDAQDAIAQYNINPSPENAQRVIDTTLAADLAAQAIKGINSTVGFPLASGTTSAGTGATSSIPGVPGGLPGIVGGSTGVTGGLPGGIISSPSSTTGQSGIPGGLPSPGGIVSSQDLGSQNFPLTPAGDTESAQTKPAEDQSAATSGIGIPPTGAVISSVTPAATAATPVSGLQAITTSTPFAKRAIGDLYPISTIMLTPEELAQRQSLQRTLPMRRGGLASIRRY